jgi:hypothetical protein
MPGNKFAYKSPFDAHAYGPDTNEMDYDKMAGGKSAASNAGPDANARIDRGVGDSNIADEINIGRAGAYTDKTTPMPTGSADLPRGG